MSRVNRSIASLLSATLSATLFATLTAGCSREPAAVGGAPPAIPVQLQAVESNMVQDSSEFVGALEAKQRVQLRPETEGRIVALLVSPGDSVSAGTPIAELDPERSQAQVGSATANVQAASAAKATVEARLQAAKAERERAAADVKWQNSEFRRMEELVKAGAQSRQDLDRVINARDTALANQRAADEEVRAAQASLGEAEAQLSRAQSERDVAATDLRDNLVRAPIDGIVGNVPVKVGDYVETSDTLTNIIQNQSLDLNLAIPAERSMQLRTGLTVQILNEENQPSIEGRISFVSPQVDTNAQSILAKATFPNGGILKDGQFVRARVVWRSNPGVLVPTAAVTRIAGQTFVYVAEAGEAQGQQVARQRLVKLGSIQGNAYQVISGVAAGDQIVTSGILNLTDGAAIVTGSPGQGAEAGTGQG